MIAMMLIPVLHIHSGEKGPTPADASWTIVRRFTGRSRTDTPSTIDRDQATQNARKAGAERKSCKGLRRALEGSANGSGTPSRSLCVPDRGRLPCSGPSAAD